ncbi:MAG TPA: hypothetical protein PKA94_01425 [Ferruginibacter sp.]|nr:hypothetical protein [Ferruginibacter sp.]
MKTISTPLPGKPALPLQDYRVYNLAKSDSNSVQIAYPSPTLWTHSGKLILFLAGKVNHFDYSFGYIRERSCSAIFGTHSLQDPTIKPLDVLIPEPVHLHKS